jgi:putative transcriptional regulator
LPKGADDVNFVPQFRERTGAAEALLAAYAAGSLSRPLHVLVASHLALRPGSRPFVAALEAMAGETMAADEPLTGVADRGQRLAAIFADPPPEPAAPREKGLLPDPLAAFARSAADDLRWRAVLPGLKQVKLQDSSGAEASLLWIRAGRAMPAHTHQGLEATLVLQGSFSDATGRYERGDIAVADDDVDHKPVAGAAEDCICYAVSEGPVKLTGPVARLFDKLLRH